MGVYTATETGGTVNPSPMARVGSTPSTPTKVLQVLSEETKFDFYKNYCYNNYRKVKKGY